MIFQTDSNYYEILEIRPDASAQDVRNAYLRLKSSYRKDNPALYSVLDPSETEDMIGKIEEAFQILSDPDARRDYDERNGFGHRIERKIFSIDRAPPSSAGSSSPFDRAPMESSDEMDLLVAPSTDFEGMATRGESTQTNISAFSPASSLPTQAPSPFPERSAPLPRVDTGFIERRQNSPSRPAAAHADPVMNEIANETEWRGTTLRRLRELRRYSLDDVASLTKISKTYLIAIEEENFGKLPAPVFVRGFLLQFARTLKIPAEPLAQAYMARLLKRGT